MGHTVRSFTGLEVEFLNHLRRAVQQERIKDGAYRGVYVTDSFKPGPALQVGLRLKGVQEIVYFDILIYGTRPVRYHIETVPSMCAQSCRTLWNTLLGPLNLILEKSGIRQGRFHLFYEVTPPESKQR